MNFDCNIHNEEEGGASFYFIYCCDDGGDYFIMEGIKVLAWWGSSSIFSQRAANARRSILHFLQSSKGNELFNSTLESRRKRGNSSSFSWRWAAQRQSAALTSIEKGTRTTCRMNSIPLLLLLLSSLV
jgi:hypothetical protein